MTGMISYADAPAFHNLVDKRDYRIVCVFEVFSQNRCEDDFLESLALIAQIIREQELLSSNNSENQGFENINNLNDFTEVAFVQQQHPGDEQQAAERAQVIYDVIEPECSFTQEMEDLCQEDLLTQGQK